jgi:hypothetical protein
VTKETLKLKCPVLIDGKEVLELSYDIDEFTVSLFSDASVRASSANSRNKVIGASGAAELDYNFHLYLGMAAVISCNSNIDWADLERIKGTDAMKLMEIGRDFIMDSESADSVPENSETLSDPMLEPTTPANIASDDLP